MRQRLDPRPIVEALDKLRHRPPSRPGRGSAFRATFLAREVIRLATPLATAANAAKTYRMPKSATIEPILTD
jgi:hypothetical protein